MNCVDTSLVGAHITTPATHGYGLRLTMSFQPFVTIATAVTVDDSGYVARTPA
jgi:hypothetical protein